MEVDSVVERVVQKAGEELERLHGDDYAEAVQQLSEVFANWAFDVVEDD